MAKVIKVIKNNIFGFVFGVIITLIISVYAASTLSSSSVYYDNSKSGGSSTTVSGALDELYNLSDIRKRPNIVSAYTYNASTCVTGEEITCVPTSCYRNTAANSCKAGDIIKYKVNDTDIVSFHVMYDNGTTLTMQSQKNVLHNTKWITEEEYAYQNGDGSTCNCAACDACNDEGPITIIEALERSTRTWTNINDKNYTLGTTVFKTSKFTGCTASSCTTNKYTLPSRTAKARMISLQEAVSLGCTETKQSCPKWMNNYLYNSTSNGGTVSDNSVDITGSYNGGYWTVSANSSSLSSVWFISNSGALAYGSSYKTNFGARAVVEINK